MKIKFQGKQPQPVNSSDLAYELLAAESFPISPDTWAFVKTGLKVSIPKGHVGMICSALDVTGVRGVFIANAPLLIEAGNHDELGVFLYNGAQFPFQVTKGHRIAQLLIVKAVEAKFVEAEEL